MESDLLIETQPQETCRVCGKSGNSLYHGLRDRMFRATQGWNMLSCDVCGSVWLSPRARKDQLSKLYEGENYYTHNASDFRLNMPLLGRYQTYLQRGYLARKFGYFEDVKMVQKLLGWFSGLRFNWSAWEDYKAAHLDAVRASNSRELLEIGCGNGAVLSRLSELGWNARGCDLDAQAVQVCLDRGLNVDHGSIETLQFPDECFDAVVSNHVIEHVDDPELFLAECFRVLKPQGQLRIVTPNSRSLGHRIFGRYWYHLDPPRHLFLFSAEGLAKLCNTVGFSYFSLSTGLRDDNNSCASSIRARRASSGAVKSGNAVWVRIVGKAFQFVEWLATPFNRFLKGELILKATKYG